MNQAAAVPQAKADELPLPSRPVAFLWHYICARPWHFGGLLALIIGAGIPLQLYREGLNNEQAWTWALVSGLMVIALWRSVRQKA